jgi:cGMP-dependent protein kinase 2
LAVDFKLAIVGSGPAGLAAAVHAAKLGVPHVLLERADHINDTIFKYQKRKLVMATPVELPPQQGLELEFKQESREEVIDSWMGSVTRAGVPRSSQSRVLPGIFMLSWQTAKRSTANTSFSPSGYKATSIS